MKQNRFMVVLANARLLLLLLIQMKDECTVLGETFTVGYLTGSQRKPGDMEYDRPGTSHEIKF